MKRRWDPDNLYRVNLNIIPAPRCHMTTAEVRGVSVDRVAGGKIVESWVSWDRLGLYQQLGVVEPTRELADRAGLIM